MELLYIYSDINANCARNDRTTRGRICIVTLGRSIRLKVGSLHYIVIIILQLLDF